MSRVDIAVYRFKIINTELVKKYFFGKFSVEASIYCCFGWLGFGEI